MLLLMVLRAKVMTRFALNFLVKALAPQLAIIAPWREWSIRSREDAIDFAEAHNYSYSCYQGT